MILLAGLQPTGFTILEPTRLVRLSRQPLPIVAVQLTQFHGMSNDLFALLHERLGLLFEDYPGGALLLDLDADLSLDRYI